MSFKFSIRLVAAVVIFIATSATNGQEHEKSVPTNGISISLGNRVVALPAPDGYEEVASQFERMKTLFAASESADTDLVAVYMPVSDVDSLRNGKSPLYVSYMKISVSKASRSYETLGSDFAAAVDFVQKNNAKMFSPENKDIKALQPQLDKALSKELSKDVTINFQQPTNLGDFDNRSNVYSNLMLMFYKAQVSGKETTIPVLTSLTFLHVKHRILMVMAYKRFDEEADKDALKQLTTAWINKILAAN